VQGEARWESRTTSAILDLLYVPAFCDVVSPHGYEGAREGVVGGQSLENVIRVICRLREVVP